MQITNHIKFSLLKPSLIDYLADQSIIIITIKKLIETFSLKAFV